MTESNILGVPVQGFTKDKLLQSLERDLRAGKRIRIVTVNNEILMRGRQDPEYRALLNEADYRVADSAGLIWASAFLAKPLSGWFKWFRAYWRAWWMLVGLLFWPKRLRTVLPGTIPGSDLAVDLAGLSERSGYGLYLLGAGQGVAVAAARKLQERFPKLEVAADASDPFPNHDQRVVERINRKRAKIILLAYDASDQVGWMSRNIGKLGAPVATMGVGGALDYLTGGKSVHGGSAAKPPPDWMRKRGLEWSWRLFHQPSRAGRIFTALPAFVHAVVRQKLDK